MILVIVLTGIIAAAFAAGLVPTMRAFLVVDIRDEALQDARIAMDRMVREIRQIRSATTADIQTWTTNNLKFNDAYGNSIEFKLNGAGPPYDLLRNTGKLSGNVESLTFTYLQKDPPAGPGGAASAENQIWKVKVELQVKISGETVKLRSEVYPVNFQVPEFL